MTDPTAAVTAETTPWPAALAPVSSGWARWIGPLLSLAIVVAVLAQIGKLDLRAVWHLVPASPAFWAAFGAFYLIGPASEWLIFRRLWGLPAAGFLALTRKMVGNEILLGYSGELYFYGWARRHAEITAAPFGAIKDVTILSAITGNISTLALMAAAWPFAEGLQLGAHASWMGASVATVVLSSLAIMTLRHRLFSLQRSNLAMIAAVHTARILGKLLLSAVMWHIALPEVAISWWLLLATLRQVVSRLPFLPNKDLVFAGLAVVLIGRHAELADLMAMTASLVLAAHLLVGGLLGAAELAEARS